MEKHTLILVIETNYNIDENTGLRGDHTIRLTGYQPKKFYPKPFCLVKYYDLENDEELEVISNKSKLCGDIPKM